VLVGNQRSFAFLEIISGIRSLKREETGKELGESINSKTSGKVGVVDFLEHKYQESIFFDGYFFVF
jgi:hypothetical protein